MNHKLEIESLAQLPRQPFRLTAIDLENTTVGALKLFGNVGNHLIDINLSGTAIIDAQLAHLKGKDLVTLDLSRTEIGDAGLFHLRDCRTLERLDVQKTKVTADGIAKLQKAIPDCEINWHARNSKP